MGHGHTLAPLGIVKEMALVHGPAEGLSIRTLSPTAAHSIT